jgi:hypothetical protein
VVAKIIHMHGGLISVIKGLSECYPWTATGYLGYLGVGYFFGCGMKIQIIM